MRPASTIVLVRQGVSEPELLFVKRPDSMRFLGGFYAFPGGALDPDDHSEAARRLSMIPPDVASRTMGADASDLPAFGFYVCALRELFEEVGILITLGPDGSAPLDAEEVHLARRDLLDGKIKFTDIVSGLGVKLGTHLLRYHTRWTAPAALTVRFDVRVFIAPAMGEPDPDPREVAAVDWKSPGQALAMTEIGSMLIAPPTVATITSLSRFASVDDLLAGRGSSVQANDPERLSPLVRRILAPNASIMTGPGTNTYLVGEQHMVVIDPASMDPSHLETISRAGHVETVVITHSHPDHLSGALELCQMTGARFAASKRFFEKFPPGEATIELNSGSSLDADGARLEILETPGHASDHICLWLEEEESLFSGDLVLGEGTTVISPPDGNLKDYLESLEKVAALRPQRLYPGHFPPRDDATDWINWYISHRQEREQQILEVISDAALTIAQIVDVVYRGYPFALHPIAERSVLAHLDKLMAEGRVVEGSGTYRRIPRDD